MGRKIGTDLKPGVVLALFGDLGGGKTTFLQGVAEGLGIKERVLSPTFIVIRDYFLKNQSGRFFHLDWYRIDTQQQLVALGLEEIFSQENIVAIEWADRGLGVLPKQRIEIYFEYCKKEKSRKISILKKE